MKKRILSLFMAFSVLFTMVPMLGIDIGAVYYTHNAVHDPDSNMAELCDMLPYAYNAMQVESDEYYIAQYNIHNVYNYDNLKESFERSIPTSLRKSLIDDKLGMSVLTLLNETVYFNGELTQQDLYDYVLIRMLTDNAVVKTETTKNFEVTQNIATLLNTVVDIDETFVGTIYEYFVLMKGKGFSYKDATEIVNNIQNHHSTLYNKLFGGFPDEAIPYFFVFASSIFELYDEALELNDHISNYYTLLSNLCGEATIVLQYMKKHTSDVFLTASINKYLNIVNDGSIASVLYTSYLEALSSGSETLANIGAILIKGGLALYNPVWATVSLGFDIIDLFYAVFCGTGGIGAKAEMVWEIILLNNVEEALLAAISDIEQFCDKYSNLKASVPYCEAYVCGMLMAFRLQTFELDKTNEYFELGYKSGWLKKYFKGDNSWEDWQKNIEYCRDYTNRVKPDLFINSALNTYNGQQKKINKGFTIIYDLDGGTGDIPNGNKPYNEAYYTTKSVPTKNGYGFWGWTNNGVLYSFDEEISASVNPCYCCDELILKAKWVAETTDSIPSSFNDAKAMVDFSSSAIGVTKGRIRYMTQLTIDTECYVADYWKYTIGGTTGTLYSGDKCTNCALSMALSYLGLDYTPGYMATLYGNSNIPSPLVDVPNLIPSIERVNADFNTLFNNYAANSDFSPIVIYFDYKHPDDGKIHPHAITIIGKNGDTYYAVDSAANVTKLVELTFNADHTAIATCSYKRYADTSSISGFCQWKLTNKSKVYTIMYDWGDYVDGVVQTVKYDTKQHGVNYMLSTEVPIYGSYVFKGWALGNDLRTPVYQPGDTYTKDADVVFYAVWDEPTTLSYTITYDYNNGSGMTAKQEKTAGVAVTLATSDPVYEGHTFIGWALGDDLNTVVYQTGDTYSDDADLYLYAVWNVEKKERNIIAEGTCGAALTWALDDDGLLTIDGTGAMTTYNSGTAPWYSYRTQISSIKIADGVTSIGDYAFRNCDILKSVTIPDTVTSIGNYAFEICDLLAEVVLGRGVTTLGTNAFRDCPKLTTLTVSDTLGYFRDEYDSYGPFRGSPISTVRVPATVTSIPENLYNHSTITTFICEESEYVGGNGYFDDDGILYKKNIYTDAQTLVKYPNSKSVKNYTVLDETTSIGAKAFQNKTMLTSITLNEGLKTIGEYAFDNCDVLKSVTIPDTVTTINLYAFNSCDLLASAYFLGNAPTAQNSIFASSASGFTVYYVEGTTGWSNPWNGYPTATFVPEDTNIPVTNIKLSSNSITLSVGDTHTLTATVIPDDATDKKVKWTSSNNAVATVANGKITAVSAGTTVIIATTNDGGYTATCIVTVEGKHDVSDDSPVIKLSEVRGNPGGTITVPVVLCNNPGLTSMTLYIEYDESIFTLTNVIDTGVIPGSMHTTKYSSPYILTWDNDTARQNITANGTIANLVFTISKEAELGDYSIVLSYPQDGILNVDVESVDFYTQNSTVTISNVVIGDITGDGILTNKDRLILARYLAGWDGYDESMINKLAADVNCDGAITNKDRLILARHLAGWEGYETLPKT